MYSKLVMSLYGISVKNAEMNNLVTFFLTMIWFYLNAWKNLPILKAFLNSFINYGEK